MKIITNKTELTLTDIQTVVANSYYNRKHKIKLKRYYEGRHDILYKKGRKNDAANNKIVNNYCSYITNLSASFFLGTPISYKTTAEKEKELNTLLEIFRYNDESAHNLNLAEESSITGEAYEILYIDADANIRFTTIPSEEIILVCDSTLEENVICAIRYFRIYDLNQVTYSEFVDVYDANKISHYSYNGAMKLLEEQEHYFGDVPIVEYPNNHQHRGDFEDVLTLVDAYNLAQSLTLDDLADFTDAFLVLKGMGGTTGEDVQELRQSKSILLDDGGAAEWLIKNINDTYVENFKTRIQRDIHKFSQAPDMSDNNFAGNTSGIAIKYKLIGLEQIRSRKEREFKKGLQRRIELIANILKLKNQAVIDFRDINIQFTANIPANILEQAQIVNQLDGVVSQKTLLGLLPFVENPVEEIEELQSERDEEISRGDESTYPNLNHEEETADEVEQN